MSCSTRSPIASARALSVAAALALSTFATPAALASYESLAGELRVVTESRLRWFGLHIYDARLQTTERFDPVRPQATRFMLELTYARELQGAKIADASRDEIVRLGFGSAAQRERWHAAMTRIFPDVAPGRRIAGVNLPDEGVVFYVDGKFAGRVDDPEFARAFFAIWLDERTAEPALRAQLLRGGRVVPTAATNRAAQ